jgi:hypothetical protein
MTYRRRDQTQKDLSPLWLYQMQQDSKRDENRHDQSHNEEFEKHHALPSAAGVEKDENDEDVGGGNDDSAPEGERGEQAIISLA